MTGARAVALAGIEFDFRRWCHMILNPLENHPALTRMVAETRRLLDDAAPARGRRGTAPKERNRVTAPVMSGLRTVDF